MIQKLTRIALIAGALVFGVAAMAVPAYAAPASSDSSSSDSSSGGSSLNTKTSVKEGITAAGGTSSSTDLPALIASVINILLFIAGAVAVIMIIIGGLRYIASNGDQTHIKAAKDTILYSVIGLIVALLAFAIVNFVVTKL